MTVIQKCPVNGWVGCTASFQTIGGARRCLCGTYLEGDGPRDGVTFDPRVDTDRLNRQQRRVFELMSDGEWHTLRDLAECSGFPEQSVSARLRDLRKPRFGGHHIDRRRVAGGLFEYRMTA